MEPWNIVLSCDVAPEIPAIKTQLSVYPPLPILQPIVDTAHMYTQHTHSQTPMHTTHMCTQVYTCSYMHTCTYSTYTYS